jgi:hypothetical protein
MTTTAAQIRAAMEALDLRQVAAHFTAGVVDDVNDDNGDDDDDLDDDDVEPLVVCDGVSVAAFNEYVGDGEGLRIGVRFLQLEADGRLLLVEFPSWVHEATADQFKFAFLDASGSRYEINTGGSFTAERAGFPSKEADATFGPLASTPNRSPKPPNVTRWVTLVVEIARSQSWPSLCRGAAWWYHYPGVEYVLLLKIPESARMLTYALYDVRIPLQPDGDLPHPVVSDAVIHLPNGPQPPVNISFDAHRILSIPGSQPLPAGVHDPIVVDLRVVLTRVFNSNNLR